MMKKYTIIFALFVFLAACHEEDVATHSTGDKLAPNNVTNVTIEPLPGGAKVTYDVPDNDDLLMVKADYQIANGKLREASSSKYKNSIILDGYGDTQEKSFQIYTIDKDGNKSKEESFKFSPLTPPVHSIFNSLKIGPDFGGVHINWTNDNKAEIALITLVKQDDEEVSEENVLYTKMEDGDYAVRGYAPEETQFGFVIRDRWENYSDTLYQAITPWYEEELERGKFKQLTLPGEANLANWGGSFNKMIDGVTNNESNYGHTKGNDKLPVVFSFDMKVKAKLSRFVIWQRHNWIYKHHNPKKWELWGSNDPATDGSDQGWEKIGTYESFKPSGLPLGKVSNEDKTYAAAGEECIIPLDAPAYRYLRFKMLESWAGGSDFMMGEMTAFGQIEEKY
ncbi:DUF5126 domain-containing protein [Puteibacter caeruleilacunae]|nr:DUF5126 domain-containing protein [Puteibacter caeruleilacunae]